MFMDRIMIYILKLSHFYFQVITIQIGEMFKGVWLLIQDSVETNYHIIKNEITLVLDHMIDVLQIKPLHITRL